MSITGERDDLPGGGPQKVGVAVSDLMTGLYSVIAIQAALLHRATTGLGQHIDMALLDVQVAMLCNQSQNYLTTGKAPGRYGNAHANIVPYQVFRAADRDFVIACGNDSQFVALCEAIGLPDLPRDPRFARKPDRVANREAVIERLAAHFLTDTADAWIARIHPRACRSARSTASRKRSTNRRSRRAPCASPSRTRATPTSKRSAARSNCPTRQ